jgi:hypothetical protein
MYQTLTVRQVSTSTIYKLVALGSVCAVVPLFTLIGWLSVLGLGSAQWNGQAITGLKGVLMSPLIGLLLSLMLTVVVGSLLALGLWLYSLVRPIRLAYWQDDEGASPSAPDRRV